MQQCSSSTSLQLDDFRPSVPPPPPPLAPLSLPPRSIENKSVETHTIPKKALMVVRSALANGMDWQALDELVRAETANGNPIASLIHELRLDRNQVRTYSQHTHVVVCVCVRLCVCSLHIVEPTNHPVRLTQLMIYYHDD